MDKGYIAPDTALKKLRAARSLKQTVYIYGATGYGKTEAYGIELTEEELADFILKMH